MAMQVDYVHAIQLTRDNACTVAGLPDMMQDFKEVMCGTTPIVYYHTTFCMGDFYVSALLYQSTVFEGAPVMPLLLLLHEWRTTDNHELLFSWFRRLSAVTRVVCVADREASITSAVRTALPDASMVYCWNHIIGDVRVNNYRMVQLWCCSVMFLTGMLFNSTDNISHIWT